MYQQNIIPFDGEIIDVISMTKYGQVLYQFKGEDGNEYMIKQVLKQNGQKEWDTNMALSKLEYKLNENIIKVYNVKETDFHYYIQMEYCHTKSIEYMEFTQELIDQLLFDVTNGLKSLKTMNIIHRDIKPQNIVYQEKVFKLIDFGTAKRLKNVNNRDFQSKQTGTLIFMAPQVYLGLTYSSKCDIWSLGATIYYILYRKSIWEQLEMDKYNAKIKWNEYFSGERDLCRDLFLNVRQNQYSDLIIKMMKLDENERLSLEEVIEYIKKKNNNQVNDDTYYTEIPMTTRENKQNIQQVLSMMNSIRKSSTINLDYKQIVNIFMNQITKNTDNVTFVMILRVLRDFLQKSYRQLNDELDKQYYRNLIFSIDTLTQYYKNSKIDIWDNQQHIQFCSNDNQLNDLLKYI